MNAHGWTGPSDADTAPSPVLPSQFERLWRGHRANNPERELALEVIGQAARDLRQFYGARTVKSRRLYESAEEWVRSRDVKWPFSFVNLCGALGLSPDGLRERLLRAPREVATTSNLRPG